MGFRSGLPGHWVGFGLFPKAQGEDLGESELQKAMEGFEPRMAVTGSITFCKEPSGCYGEEGSSGKNRQGVGKGLLPPSRPVSRGPGPGGGIGAVQEKANVEAFQREVQEALEGGCCEPSADSSLSHPTVLRLASMEPRLVIE